MAGRHSAATRRHVVGETSRLSRGGLLHRVTAMAIAAPKRTPRHRSACDAGCQHLWNPGGPEFVGRVIPGSHRRISQGDNRSD